MTCVNHAAPKNSFRQVVNGAFDTHCAGPCSNDVASTVTMSFSTRVAARYPTTGEPELGGNCFAFCMLRYFGFFNVSGELTTNMTGAALMA
jgi:hypothetical protein